MMIVKRQENKYQYMVLQAIHWSVVIFKAIQ